MTEERFIQAERASPVPLGNTDEIFVHPQAGVPPVCCFCSVEFYDGERWMCPGCGVWLCSECRDSEFGHEKDCRYVYEGDADARQRHKQSRWRQLATAARLLPDARVRNCCKRPISKKQGVEVYRVPGGGACFGKLQRCGSVWICPVCAPGITEERRVDLEAALASARAQGLSVYMLTLTVTHHAGNNVASLCARLLKARERMRNQRSWRQVLAPSIGLVGSVRAVEVTYGKNGAHPHIHELLFCTGSEPSVSSLLQLWKAACLSVGFPPEDIDNEWFDAKSVNVQDGSDAGKYLGKFGLQYELTKGDKKHGRVGNLTPWQLLAAATEGDSKAGELFVEHARAFKGKKQLVWSRGLRAKLSLSPEKSDEQAAEEVKESKTIETETPVRLGTFNNYDWDRVLRYGLRSDVLIAAENAGWAGVQGLLDRVYRLERAKPYIATRRDWPPGQNSVTSHERSC